MLKGKHLSEEHRRKISDAMKGHAKSEEHRKKIIQALKRRAPASKETRRKISDALKGAKNPWFGKRMPEETRRVRQEKL